MSRTPEPVLENLARRMSRRQGLRLEKCRRRDPRALDYGIYRLYSRDGSVVCTTRDLNEIVRFMRWTPGEKQTAASD